MDMPTHFIIINLEPVSLTKKLVETLEQSSTNVGEKCRILETQEALVGSNLLSLPHLPTRRTSGKEPLIAYSQSNVVTSKEYLTIMQQKAMVRDVTKLIKKTRGGGNQNKQARKVLTIMTMTKRVIEREFTKQQ